MKSIVILTGAGISAESGLKTFRDSNGLWEGHRPEEVATPEAFAANPDMVHRFYNQRRAQLSEVEPNAAHLALADLEKSLGDDFLLVTQNVDNLHERAGNTRVLHMHGELGKMRCALCSVTSPCTTDLATTDVCESCDRPGGLRPDIVWFGEMPYHLDRIYEALEAADLFIAIGTSGVVYPAAQFVSHARQHRARTVEINLEAAANSDIFDESILGPATEKVPIYVERVLTALGK
ncbi:MAG: Sir2 family NAD+-dependent deacetylase [Verrucomicrobiota bacterium]